MWIRQVLVPEITDKEEDLVKLKEFISSLSTVEKIEFLPYHSMGRFKWEDLGFSYALADVREATIEDVKRAKRIVTLY